MTTELMDAPAAVSQSLQDSFSPAVQQAGALTAQQPRPLTVIEHAMRTGATPAEMREILAALRDMDMHQLELMREKRRMDEEVRKVAAQLAFDEALSRFRSHNVIIPRTKEVVQSARGGGPGPRFWQAEFDEVCRRLSGPLSECGFGFRHDMRFGAKRWMTEGVENDNPWVFTVCLLTHKQGHTERLELDGPPWDGGSMNDLQRMSASGSFLKRVGLLTITGTPTGGEDDEGARGAAGDTPRKAQRRDPDGDSQAAIASLSKAGHDKATQGMKVLTGWWAGLTEDQRKSITPEFGAMRQAARQFDEGAR